MLQDQNTAIHIACRGTYTGVLQILIDAGVDVNTRDKVSMFPVC